MYKVPESSKAFGTTYPVSIDFDSKGNVYFVGIRSPVLWFGNVTQMKNDTSNGISKIPIPTSAFKGIEEGLGNSTGTFSQESFPMQDIHTGKRVSFIFTPAINLKPGEYMLMLGARNNEVGMLKAIKVHIIS
jgi:hypothetical protein